MDYQEIIKKVRELYGGQGSSKAASNLVKSHYDLIVAHVGGEGKYPIDFFIRCFEWVVICQKLYPNFHHWCGLYFKESFLYCNKKNSQDLLLGPFLGEPTEHTRISIDKGFCGMAIREQRVVNIGDVNLHKETHIACSLKTRSEIVIPLYDPRGEMVAELDIDSNILNAFDPEKEAHLKKFSQSFSALF